MDGWDFHAAGRGSIKHMETGARLRVKQGDKQHLKVGREPQILGVMVKALLVLQSSIKNPVSHSFR